MFEYMYIVYLILSFFSAMGMTLFALTFGYIMREAKVGDKQFDIKKTGLTHGHITVLKLFYFICFLLTILFAGFSGMSIR
jgi:hypothetical protein